MPEFEPGQKVYIQPYTHHNWRSEPREASFDRYMAGNTYAILAVTYEYAGSREVKTIRANVADLTSRT